MRSIILGSILVSLYLVSQYLLELYFCHRVKQSSLSPGSISPNSTQAPVVNFRDIGDLAKSSNRDQGMVYVAVNPHSLPVGAHPPLLMGISDIVSNTLSCTCKPIQWLTFS